MPGEGRAQPQLLILQGRNVLVHRCVQSPVVVLDALVEVGVGDCLGGEAGGHSDPRSARRDRVGFTDSQRLKSGRSLAEFHGRGKISHTDPLPRDRFL